MIESGRAHMRFWFGISLIIAGVVVGLYADSNPTPGLVEFGGVVPTTLGLIVSGVIAAWWPTERRRGGVHKVGEPQIGRIRIVPPGQQ